MPSTLKNKRKKDEKEETGLS